MSVIGYAAHPGDKYGQQDFRELGWMLDSFVKRAQSILEIGSCYGQTLKLMAESAKWPVLVRSIDLGIGVGPLEGIYTGLYLQQSIDYLKQNGHDARVLLEDSASPLAIAWAKKWAPYDFIFIDGDHTYEGVRNDWKNYGPMGKVVGFHDVGGEIKEFWNEIKLQHETKELILSNMGIGVVVQ